MWERGERKGQTSSGTGEWCLCGHRGLPGVSLLWPWAPRGGSWLLGMLFPNVPLQCAILMICAKESTWNAVRSLSLMANAFQYGVI